MKEKSLEKKSFLEKIGIIERVPLDEIASEGLEAEIGITDSSKLLNNENQVNSDEDIKTEPEIENSSFKEIEKSSYNKEPEKRVLLQSDEIFEKFNVNSEGTSTIFVIENYLKALPDYLPADVKKESVLNIISSSQIPLDSLMSDGKAKIDSLNNYSKDFSKYIENSLNNYEKELDKLKAEIKRCNEAINGLNRLNSEQSAVIEYENERINNIFNFIK